MRKTVTLLIVIIFLSSAILCQTQSAGTRPAATSPKHRDTEPEAYVTKLKNLAGPDAANCGRVGVDEQTGTANKCAKNAFKNGKAFYVVYELRATDSAALTSVVRNAKGQMWQISYSGKGYSGNPHLYVSGSELSSGAHVLTEPCPTPYRLLEGRNGGLRPPGWKPERGERLSCLPFWK
jgi:hypothetical protein